MATWAPGRSLTSPSQRLAETAGAASSATPMAVRAPAAARAMSMASMMPAYPGRGDRCVQARA